VKMKKSTKIILGILLFLAASFAQTAIEFAIGRMDGLTYALLFAPGILLFSSAFKKPPKSKYGNYDKSKWEPPAQPETPTIEPEAPPQIQDTPELLPQAPTQPATIFHETKTNTPTIRLIPRDPIPPPDMPKPHAQEPVESPVPLPKKQRIILPIVTILLTIALVASLVNLYAHKQAIDRWKTHSQALVDSNASLEQSLGRAVSLYKEKRDLLAFYEDNAVFTTPSGTKYHVAGCQHLDGSNLTVRKPSAAGRSYDPCSVCNPDMTAQERLQEERREENYIYLR